MTTEHPVSPPSLAIIKKWIVTNGLTVSIAEASAIASLASRLGADQELEACCEWLEQNCGRWDSPAALRAARRSKPLSLKEQALALVEQHEDGWRPSPKDWDTIRRALEALPND